MPPIRDLHRSRCALARSLGVGAATVAGDNLDAGMLAQPSCDGLAAAFRQEIDDTPALQVADDGAVALATPPTLHCPSIGFQPTEPSGQLRPFIDADHPRRGMAFQLSGPD